MRKLECELPKRKKNRLANYDYSQCGAYFLTICVQNHEQILWKNNAMPDITYPFMLHENGNVGANSVRPPALSEIGLVVDEKINEISTRYPMVDVDKYVIMPNHIHLIIVLRTMDKNGRTLFAPTISRIIKQFKEAITKQIGWSIWQRSFHDHIIRNNDEYEKIWDYIEYNPINWQQDCYYSVTNNN